MIQVQPDYLIKLGTGVLTDTQSGKLVTEQIEALALQVSGLMKEGKRFLVVSSGAVGAGLEAMGLETRPDSAEKLSQLQACAALGQTRLMHTYEQSFREHGIKVAQLLLSRSDLEEPSSRQRVFDCLQSLLSRGDVLPVINENDSVATEELAYGDNDYLASEVVLLSGAKLFVLLTAVKGLLKEGELVKEVSNIEEAMSLVVDEKGKLSVGGMQSKLEAIARALKEGGEAIIADGWNLAQLPVLLEGKGEGTRFLL